MGRIAVLSDLLANKIAAGEVVERPASVIKELLENAVDADSTQIIVEIEQGGLDLIKVSDNGYGMEKDDALKAFERHATSKIKTDKDLFRIRTLGFRGEALPSIASVAKVEAKTRTLEANEGTLVKIDGGTLVAHDVCAAKKGTEIAVRDLFYNTPARLKYLKSIQTELGHILDYVNRMALAHPQISFRLYHNGRQVIQTPGDGKLLHAVAAIYGSDIARQMVPVEWETYDYKIEGVAGYPELNRANRNHCSFFINGRFVRSYQLMNAVQSAYHTLLPINRYPVVVLSLTLDPGLVDVNVHPNKLEVRFSEEKDVMTAVQQAVESALKGQTFIPKATAKSFDTEPKEKSSQETMDLRVISPPAEPKPAPTAPARYVPGANGPKYREPLPQGGALVRETPTTAYRPKERERERDQHLSRQQVDAALGAYRRPPDDQPKRAEEEQVRLSGQTGQSRQSGSDADDSRAEDVLQSAAATPDPEQASLAADATAPQEQEDVRANVPQFQPVAQVLGMYIVAQDETGLYLIDQHAAHEKVLFEKFSGKLAARQLHPLPLLVPLTLELTAAEAAQLEERIPALLECQIEVESFGGKSFLIRSVPDIWEGQNTQALLQELIDELLQEGSARNPLQLIENKVISKACKAAIKANQWLSMPEMIALCDQLRELKNPFTCPHGRPIIIHMSNYDLEKQFKRVM
ncbi:DNA mismatch repair protein MutL [Tumebacillus sp. BK434]|uniref:DNA mismatch repair endonuclease MutL n=1 Tax=Tumebacillus sp. BK434 TaxID=2512169 RepID=UPI0010DEC5E8|nr:DNA mismatch repair endonuclease MutL [Tumebacillus sp. BK434]TCP59100.1 DNA mismatch repair protein MutL [Tumebacillus sp. BK434]